MRVIQSVLNSTDISKAKSLKEKESISSVTGELQLTEIIAGAIHANKSFAFWKNQGSGDLNGVISLSNTIKYDKSELETASPGFLVSPFRNDARHKDIKIDADLVFHRPGESAAFRVTRNRTDSSANSLLRSMESVAHAYRPLSHYLPLLPAGDTADYGDKFTYIVQQAVNKIKEGAFTKVVPSRYTDVAFPPEWDFISAFERLCKHYPGAFVYLFGIPGIGTWMGATPELLLSIVNKRWFKSVALAGTQKIPESGELSQVAWTQKEIEEQALVSRYVINCFKKIRVREYEERGPKTIQAGNLAHLKTEFEVDMQAVNFPQLGTVMLELLHPTSAVCGMPLEPALAFLESNEGYEREYFTGYLGPVNVGDTTQLFVNLRSMKLLSDKARLFAGAGITEDSDPAKEWDETELKFQTLKKLFEKA